MCESKMFDILNPFLVKLLRRKSSLNQGDISWWIWITWSMCDPAPASEMCVCSSLHHTSWSHRKKNYWKIIHYTSPATCNANNLIWKLLHSLWQYNKQVYSQLFVFWAVQNYFSLPWWRLRHRARDALG